MAAKSLQNDGSVVVTDYRIEKLLEGSGKNRIRLLVTRDGERKGSFVLESEEEGQELIKKLNGEPLRSYPPVWKRIGGGRRVGAIQARIVASVPRLTLSERFLWATVALVSWAITMALLITTRFM